MHSVVVRLHQEYIICWYSQLRFQQAIFSLVLFLHVPFSHPNVELESIAHRYGVANTVRWKQNRTISISIPSIFNIEYQYYWQKTHKHSTDAANILLLIVSQSAKVVHSIELSYLYFLCIDAIHFYFN